MSATSRTKDATLATAEDRPDNLMRARTPSRQRADEVWDPK